MAKLRINGDSSGYVDLEAPNAASSSTLDLDQVPQKNVANTFTTGQNITVPTNGGLTIQAGTNGSASLRLKNDATDWDVNCQMSDNFAIYNHTTGGNRLGITPAGIVTTPSQPAFHVINRDTNYSGATAVKWAASAALLNNGSHWNLSTHSFTAPVAGMYFFTWSGLFRNVTSGARAWFQKNGSKHYPGGSSSTDIYQGGGGEYKSSMSATIQLSASDYVEVYINPGSTGDLYGNSNGHNGLSGFLIG